MCRLSAEEPDHDVRRSAVERLKRSLYQSRAPLHGDDETRVLFRFDFQYIHVQTHTCSKTLDLSSYNLGHMVGEWLVLLQQGSPTILVRGLNCFWTDTWGHFFLTLLFDVFFFWESNQGPHWMVQRAGFSPRAII